MTVQELIAELQKYPGESKILLLGDYMQGATLYVDVAGDNVLKEILPNE